MYSLLLFRFPFADSTYCVFVFPVMVIPPVGINESTKSFLSSVVNESV